MNRLDELIQRLCPDGVEYEALENICEIKRGIRVVKSQLNQSGKYPVYQNSLTPLGFFEQTNAPANTTFIIVAGAAGEIGYSICDFWAADDCFYFLPTSILSSRYLYHFLLMKQPYLFSKVRKASIPRLARSAIEKLKIPFPPLEVQREIVRILDQFTELTVELTAQLTAELTARKKQYEHYRDVLFSVKECEYVLIKDLATTNIGLATSVTKHKVKNGILLLHNSDIQQNRIVLKQCEYISEEFAQKNAKKLLQKDDIITVHTGDVGTSAVIDNPYIGAIGFTTITTRINDNSKIIPQYLCHYLNSGRCKADISAMTISDRNNLNQKSFEKLAIPIPPLGKQHHIVSILEHVNTLYNDLTSGLTAEIKARRKQYEYYRDKLLTFQEMKVK